MSIEAAMNYLFIPKSVRRALERDIHAALNPPGMSVHNGRGQFDASHVQFLLSRIDGARKELWKSD